MMKENEEVYVQLNSQSYTFLFPLSCIKKVAIEEHLYLKKHQDGSLYMQDQPICMYSFSTFLHEETEEEKICCVLALGEVEFILRVAAVGDVISYNSMIIPLPELLRTKDNACISGCLEWQPEHFGFVVDCHKLWLQLQESVRI